jgi:hypothetical protein
MGRVLRWKGRLFNCFVFWVRQGMIERVVLVIFQVALPVFAGPSFDRGNFLAVLRLMRISGWHNQ